MRLLADLRQTEQILWLGPFAFKAVSALALALASRLLCISSGAQCSSLTCSQVTLEHPCRQEAACASAQDASHSTSLRTWRALEPHTHRLEDVAVAAKRNSPRRLEYGGSVLGCGVGGGGSTSAVVTPSSRAPASAQASLLSSPSSPLSVGASAPSDK